jgi:hypothetical protein
MGTSHEGLFTFMIVYGRFLFRMRNVSDRVLGTIKTHILYSVTFFWKSCLLWDNVEKYCRARQATDDYIIWDMHFACWLTKATDTHSGICNTYCFSMAILVLPTCQNVSLTCTLPVFWIKCLYCWLWLPLDSIFILVYFFNCFCLAGS